MILGQSDSPGRHLSTEHAATRTYTGSPLARRNIRRVISPWPPHLILSYLSYKVLHLLSTLHVRSTDTSPNERVPCWLVMQALLKRPALLAGGGVAYVGGVVLAYEYLSPRPPLPSACERCCTFNALAPSYDAEIERDEASSGILELRREIAAYAKGKVLEVAGGTGRNLAFYTEAVSELLVTDFSQDMLKVGAGKVAKLRAAEGGAPGLSNVTLAVVDAAAMPLESAQYDTVIDSFGICSFEEPQAALEEMKRWFAPSWPWPLAES